MRDVLQIQARLPRIAALVAVIVVGLVWRRADLGLPFFLWKYGGSALWGSMVFLLVGVAFVRLPIAGRIFIAVSIAVAVEMSRLIHTDWLDSFRLTLPGELLLGRLFSPWNIVAYVVGILAAAMIEAAPSLLRRSGSPPAP